jgi:hypothetical protein
MVRQTLRSKSLLHCGSTQKTEASSDEEENGPPKKTQESCKSAHFRGEIRQVWSLS